MFVMHLNTKADSLYVNTYLTMYLIVIFLILKCGDAWVVGRVVLCALHESQLVVCLQ